MHSYLRTVGFSGIREKKELDALLKDVVENFDERNMVDRGDHVFVELVKLYGYDNGITVCGEYDENNVFQMEYYYPFFRGTGVTSYEEVTVEKHAGKESYAGVCDDLRSGVALIFYLENAAEYFKRHKQSEIMGTKTSVTLSALAKEGKILLPLAKSLTGKPSAVNAEKNRLIAAAKNGDEEAMESLTLEDMDMYSVVSRRIQNEDVFTIVESYFMPYGVECDQYNIMGEITEIVEDVNESTKEKMYHMSLLCNDMSFDVCINQKDLMGKPEVGRRFKGLIWLQGTVNF